MFYKTLDPLDGLRHGKISLDLAPLPIQNIDRPESPCITLIKGDGVRCEPKVAAGDTVTKGQPLGQDANGDCFPSPVAGDVQAVIQAPDLRGMDRAQAVKIKPAPEQAAAFPPLDPAEVDAQALADRIREAGVVTDAYRPRPLVDVLTPVEGQTIDTVVLLAIDREPRVRAAVQFFRECGEEAPAAATLLGMLSGASRLMLAVPEPLAADAERICAGTNLGCLPIEAAFPNCLEPLVALEAGGGSGVRVVALETALAALDAVRSGKVQIEKVLTLIGPDGQAIGNYRVHLGTPLRDVLALGGLEPDERDKVVVGGPMRGFAQYSLDTVVDAGVDAVMLIPASEVIDWSDEPCVSCGNCTEICPVNLQIHLIGRYAEFELFERAEDLGLFNCIECGLCAAVCTARRPLVQWVQLAKKERRKEQAARELAAREAAAMESGAKEQA